MTLKRINNICTNRPNLLLSEYHVRCDAYRELLVYLLVYINVDLVLPYATSSVG